MSDITGITNQSSATNGADALTGIKATVTNLNTDKVEASSIAALTAKTTPVNADTFPITDTQASNVLKNLSFTNLKAFLKTYLDTLYPAIANFTGTSSGTNTGDNATNTQYSGLAASKQDTLVSATNIKTVNGNSLLGSGDVAVGGSTALAVTTAQFSNGSSTSETDIIANTNVPGGSLSAGRCIRIELIINLNGTHSYSNTYKVYYGGSAVASAAFNSSAVLTNVAGTLIVTIAYNGTSAQYIGGALNVQTNVTLASELPQFVAITTTSAVNSASAQNVKVTVQGSANISTNQVFMGTIHLI